MVKDVSFGPRVAMEPGNCHDSTLLQMTDLWHRLYDICHLVTQVVGDVLVPALVLGDGAFPFRTYLMKRFSQAVLTQDQKKFNKAHSNSRVVVENAFGILKGRFRLLTKSCESHPENLKYMTLACVVIHNYLHDHDEHDVNVNQVPANDIGFIRQQQNRDNAAAASVRDVLLPLLQ